VRGQMEGRRRLLANFQIDTFQCAPMRGQKQALSKKN
jgi:hypothetical protein